MTGLDTKEIGQRIKKLRKDRNLKQDDLAYILRDKETGIPLSRGQISNYETGRRKISVDILRTLCNYFGVTPETLGVKTNVVSTIELLERSKLLFEDEKVPLEEKEELYESIMRMYISAKDQLKDK